MLIDACTPVAAPPTTTRQNHGVSLLAAGVSTMNPPYLGRVPSANQVAAALREHLPGVEGGRLHRLLYYCQGHHLALFGQPAFDEPITAGPDGPEIADLNDDHARHVPGAVRDSVHSVAVMVASRYGGLTDNDLGRLSRAENPWARTQPGRPISHDEMAAFFRGPGAQEGAERFTPDYLAAVAEEVRQARTRTGKPLNPNTFLAEAAGRDRH